MYREMRESYIGRKLYREMREREMGNMQKNKNQSRGGRLVMTPTFQPCRDGPWPEGQKEGTRWPH